jgi:hypothetical protein
MHLLTTGAYPRERESWHIESAASALSTGHFVKMSLVDFSLPGSRVIHKPDELRRFEISTAAPEPVT